MPEKKCKTCKHSCIEPNPNSLGSGQRYCHEGPPIAIVIGNQVTFTAVAVLDEHWCSRWKAPEHD